MVSLVGDVIKECRYILKDLSMSKIIFVKRSSNIVAHSFVRASLSYHDCIFSLEDVPTELLPYLVADMEV